MKIPKLNILAYFTVYHSASLQEGEINLELLCTNNEWKPFSYQQMQNLYPSKHKKIKIILKTLYGLIKQSLPKIDVLIDTIVIFCYYTIPMSKGKQSWPFNVFCAITNNRVFVVQLFRFFSLFFE